MTAPREKPGEAFARWYHAYCASTDRHTGRTAAHAWYAAGVSATEAAHWARFGFTYDTALPHITAGRAPSAAARLNP